MVKIRPIVVISPRRRSNQLVTVVPISSTAPSPVDPWHYEPPVGAYPAAKGRVWVKANMIATMAVTRLDRIRVSERGGRHSYLAFHLGPSEMLANWCRLGATPRSGKTTIPRPLLTGLYGPRGGLTSPAWPEGRGAWTRQRWGLFPFASNQLGQLGRKDIPRGENPVRRPCARSGSTMRGRRHSSPKSRP